MQARAIRYRALSNVPDEVVSPAPPTVTGNQENDLLKKLRSTRNDLEKYLLQNCLSLSHEPFGTIADPPPPETAISTIRGNIFVKGVLNEKLFHDWLDYALKRKDESLLTEMYDLLEVKLNNEWKDRVTQALEEVYPRFLALKRKYNNPKERTRRLESQLIDRLCQLLSNNMYGDATTLLWQAAMHPDIGSEVAVDGSHKVVDLHIISDYVESLLRLTTEIDFASNAAV